MRRRVSPDPVPRAPIVKFEKLLPLHLQLGPALELHVAPRPVSTRAPPWPSRGLSGPWPLHMQYLPQQGRLGGAQKGEGEPPQGEAGPLVTVITKYTL